MRTVDPVWRPAHELPAAVAWAVSSVIMFAISGPGAPGFISFLWPATLIFSLVRCLQALALWERKAQLTQQRDLQFESPELFRRVEKAQRRARRGRLKIEG